jgi:hypothetical protein
MKNLFLLFAASVFFFASCNNASTTEKSTSKDSTATANVFGKAFENTTPTPANDVYSQIKTGKEFHGVMEGRITAVCQEKGCWADLELAGGQHLKVKFRDANGEEFGINKDTKDKMIDVHGVGYMDTVSVEMLRHYAEDDKATKAEIEAIKNPEITPSFTADGAVIKQ